LVVPELTVPEPPPPDPPTHVPLIEKHPAERSTPEVEVVVAPPEILSAPPVSVNPCEDERPIKVDPPANVLVAPSPKIEVVEVRPTWRPSSAESAVEEA